MVILGVGVGAVGVAVLSLALRKSFTVDKGCDQGLSTSRWRLWLLVLSRQYALSESLHWGKVLLRELLVLRNPVVYC